MPPYTAGIIVIGDEILKGITKDTNSHYISKRLYSMGVTVRKISVIPDDVVAISKEVSEFAKNYDVVITTGGVGPTHDDVTYSGVAKAFEEKLEMHKQMAQIIKVYCPGGGLSLEKNPALKMAYLPKSSALLKLNTAYLPIVRVHNVLLFPGVPQELIASFSQLEIADMFSKDRNLAEIHQFHCYRLYFLEAELELVSSLNKSVEKFGDYVNFGVYPVLGNKFYRTMVTVESLDELLAGKAVEYFRKGVRDANEVPPPPGESTFGNNEGIITYKSIANRSSERVYQLLSSQDAPDAFKQSLKKAIEMIEACFLQYDPATDVFISFNGGKDCTALLHLVFAVIQKCYPNGTALKSLYIITEDPIVELEEFVNNSAIRYDLQLYRLRGPLKEALQKFVNEHNSFKAVLIGTRQTDHKSLEYFQMTDGDWPRLMRVSPFLDWSHDDICMFLHMLSVPYCCIYNKGYTSTGDHGKPEKGERKIISRCLIS